MKTSYLRPEIGALTGYTPGEQPRIPGLIKLNTNENPYPPSPRVAEALKAFNPADLRRYPAPASDELRSAIAAFHGVGTDRVIIGNGSDDLLTMIFRAFTDPQRPAAAPEPSYSLYPVLAAMQGAPFIRIPLQGERFELPSDFSARAAAANLLLIVRPNAPTGNSFPLNTIREICREFDGMVVIDEAYADFADDNAMALAAELDNVVVTRTFSKSYSLAGLRLGYAVSSPAAIEAMMKLKDSYNVDRLTQTLGLAAFRDRDHLRQTCAAIRTQRDRLRSELLKLGFQAPESQSNFVFAAPPDGDGERYFRGLRSEAVLVRYFPGPVTGRYVRITVGTPDEMDRLLEITRRMFQ